MTSVARSVVTCQADADVSLPPPLTPLLLLPSLTHLLSSSPSFSRSLSLSLSLSPSPSLSIYLSLSFFLFLSLSHYSRHRGRNPIHTTLSVPHSSSRNVPSRLNPHNPSPFSSFTARSLTSSPPPACLPACCPPAGLILVIVPASILNPPFPLALFSSDTNGVISPFSTISYRFSSKVYCITAELANIFSVCSGGSHASHACLWERRV